MMSRYEAGDTSRRTYYLCCGERSIYQMGDRYDSSSFQKCLPTHVDHRSTTYSRTIRYANVGSIWNPHNTQNMHLWGRNMNQEIEIRRILLQGGPWQLPDIFNVHMPWQNNFIPAQILAPDVGQPRPLWV